ncbi:MAG: hypothetical protein EAZ53_13920 [Bacteroidetes bacterium]|nr:MAG: hypothetical protein EAZ53_13920 [Bacteroidota bacterium]
MRTKIILFLFLNVFILNAQKNSYILDSLNESRKNERGLFKLYIKKFKAEVITGVYRTRKDNDMSFKALNFTYLLYLPFQFDLNYANNRAREKLLKINPLVVIHHSTKGNYAAGLATKISFLVFRKAYLSYQLGLIWCEVTNPIAGDGLTNKGFNLHHNLAFSYSISKSIEISLNVLHVSNGSLFKTPGNLQDVFGIGIAFMR